MKRWWDWRKRDEELEKEMRHHLRMAEKERLERGAAPRDAQVAARREFGNPGLVKELARDVWGWRWLEDLVDDVRYGVRVLRQNPAFTATAVLAIALGVGLNVGIFSVLNGMALRLLPVPRAEQLLSVSQVFHGSRPRNVHNEVGFFSYSEYLDYRDHNHVFTGLAAYDLFVEATLSRPKVEQLLGTLTSCNYFEVLNEHPAQGRGFIDSDCAAPGTNAVVVISDQLWRSTFAADPALVGKGIILNRKTYTVIGITQPEFTGTEPLASAFWAPVTMQKGLDGDRERLADNKQSWLALLGRVRPHVSVPEVRADLSVIAGRIDQQYPGSSTSLAISTARFFGKPEERKVLIPVASVILAAFALVLVIACANVSNLLLARASARHKEIALRLAIGAGRSRLIRQLLTESLLLSLVGGALGSLLAFWSFASITRFVTSVLPKEVSGLTVNVAPDFRVLAYALGLTLLTGVAFGLLPALKSSRADLNSALKGDGAHSGSSKRSGRFLRNAFVGAQIAVCMVLVLVAGLLLRGLYHAQTVDPGFDVKNVAQAFFNLRTQGYDEKQAAVFVRQLRDRAAALPGVVAVAQAECAPLSGDHSGDSFVIPGRPGSLGIEYNHISPEYFSVVGIPIVRGRNFAPNDWRDASAVIVPESTARRLWPGEDAIGKAIREEHGGEYTVIGVAKDAQVSHLGDVEAPYLYYPAGPQDSARSYVLVRFTGNFTDMAKSFQQTSQSLDPGVTTNLTKLEDNLEIWRRPSRIATGLAGCLGVLALLLALVGVYGMVSYSVNRSVREIGIRMALGAQTEQVLRLVLRQIMGPVLFGALLGVAACAAVSWILSSMMFGLSARDPIAFVCVPVFLLLVALVASYIPARRATLVDPMVALRYE
jgi:macrolide transport system ATP-binding/permease protein